VPPLFLDAVHDADFVYNPAFDSGGLLWPLLFDRLMLGLMIAQFVVTAVLGVKEAKIAVSEPNQPNNHTTPSNLPTHTRIRMHLAVLLLSF
jgi:hypothetical protein